jgi:hypothetical protein
VRAESNFYPRFDNDSSGAQHAIVKRHSSYDGERLGIRMARKVASSRNLNAKAVARKTMNWATSDYFEQRLFRSLVVRLGKIQFFASGDGDACLSVWDQAETKVSEVAASVEIADVFSLTDR